MAMKACIGTDRAAEAESDLRGMTANKSLPETTRVSALEVLFTATGAEAAKEIMMMLFGRFRAGAASALRVVKMVAERGCCAVRARVAAELASDDSVVALFVDNSTAKERNAMHTLLWNWGQERFRSKEYDISAELFEKWMLYVPRDEEKSLALKLF